MWIFKDIPLIFCDSIHNLIINFGDSIHFSQKYFGDSIKIYIFAKNLRARAAPTLHPKQTPIMEDFRIFKRQRPRS